MALRRPTRRWGPVAVALVTLAATTVLLAGSNGAVASETSSTDYYLVQLSGAPIATYSGGISGIPATKPAAGQRVDVRSTAATKYRAHLKTERVKVLARAGLAGRPTTYDYDVVFNGFAAKMTAREADVLRRTSGVVNVWRNEVVRTDTVSTPNFLGMTGSSGVWASQFGSPARAGEGVIVGVVDTGFWPESPSFAPLPEPRPDAATIAAKFHGICDAGADPDPANRVTCNNKVIGARYYTAGGLNTEPGEFQSPRDANSHGSHTASTAAGNNGVPATINGLNVGTASGMAPAARIAVYKALWNQADGTGSGATMDLQAAVNDAVADGVDVINYSISGSTSLVIDPVELAFLFAADAGVFVAASAGNNGPGASTVAHNSPWITTVAASTHDRSFSRSVTLGNGTTITGPGVGPGVPSSPLIYSTSAGLPGADPTQVRLCFSGTLDPAKVTGKIVACDRGTNARVDKSLAVQMAGGVGMILMNTSPNSLNADFHFVPSIHVNEVARATILAYITSAGAGATASLSSATTETVEAPAMAAFSSNGPARAGGGDLLKPDISAPGVDVIAAVSPAGDNGNLYDALSGTSMSSPHIAGIAALIISKNPTWSPMRVKSAMMTTASQVDNAGNPIVGPNGTTAATPLNFGSGHVVPGSAFDPGLVYDSNLTDWVRYGCGVNQFQLVFDPSVCASFGSIDPSNLNYPSIAVGDLAGTQTITRTVTNVTGRASQYDVSVSAPAGFTISVSPTRLVIAPGLSQSYSVTITRTTATLGSYAFGSLTWSDKVGDKRGHVVRSPIAVRPVAAAAPAQVDGTGTSGSAVITVRPGYTGTLTAAAHGLVAATVADFHLVGTNTNFNTGAPATGPAVGKTTVTAPAGTRLARFALFGTDYPDGTDLDLFVYNAGTNTLVGASSGGTADETVNLATAGTFDVYVVQFALGTGVTEQDVHQFSWAVGSAAAGNLTVSPASQAAATGVPVTVTATWSGLTAGVRYLGVVSYGDGTNEIGNTTLAVNA